jgi:transglutaminase/protease-like cytokinesis protein 3
MKKVIYLMAVVGILAAMFISCKKDIPVKSVELDLNAATLAPGEVLKLKATIKPSDATNNEVSWTSSNKSVATVSSSGVVVAVTVGTAVITVTTDDGNKMDDCIITVNSEGGGDIPVSSVELDRNTSTLAPGNVLTLTATIKPSNATNKGVSWTSSNTNVVTVSSSGVVMAVADGTAVITVTTDDGNKTDDCTITVTSEGGDEQAIVSSIVDVWNEETITFMYDAQNRLSSVNWGGDNGTISYPSNNSIRVIMWGSEYMFTLNNDGYIVKCCVEGECWNYEYENGYLKREVYDDGGYINYTWENGNLKSRQDSDGYSTTYTYGATPYKKANIAPYSLPPSSLLEEGDMMIYFILPEAYFGKRSKNLLTSVSTYNTKYRYQTNSDGYVTKVYSDWGEGEELRFEIRYK